MEPACPFPILHVAFPGLWPGKTGAEGRVWNHLPSVQQHWSLSQGWPGSRRASVALLEGLAGTQSCRAHLGCEWLLCESPAVQCVPSLLGDGKGICGCPGVREHLRCHSNPGIETFPFQLPTKPALVRWSRWFPTHLKGTSHHFY